MVNQTINELNLDAVDSAAIQLARRYATVIDGCDNQQWAMRWLAPLLLDVLETLGATPASRSRIKEGKPAPAQNNPLTVLRNARRA